MSGALLVELRGLMVEHRGRRLLGGVDLDVHEGQVTALMGPSGSGKSLTARVILGCVDVDPGVTGGSLRFPSEGDHNWIARARGRGRGRLMRETRRLRGSFMTYAPQSASSALNPGRTLGRQLAIAMERAGIPRSEHADGIRTLLHEVGLPERAAAALPGELSGGMCQRAALAIAVAPRPRLVIADEPETGLDPVLTRVVTELLYDLCRQRGCGLLLISHRDETVDRIADRVVRLGGGHGEGG
jgi:peptide/nickel transport system ATP-binding protein